MIRDTEIAIRFMPCDCNRDQDINEVQCFPICSHGLEKGFKKSVIGTAPTELCRLFVKGLVLASAVLYSWPLYLCPSWILLYTI